MCTCGQIGIVHLVNNAPLSSVGLFRFLIGMPLPFSVSLVAVLDNVKNATMTDSTVTFNLFIDDESLSVKNNSSENLFSAEFLLVWEEKIEKWKKVAEEGDAEGQVQLGACYYFGDGVPRDVTEAVKWYRKAAEQGNAEAQCRLGLCYDTGTGVQQNKEEAVEWYNKAAEQGHVDALHLLGASYYYGWGVPKDEEQAVKWLHQAEERGCESAVTLLHQMGK